MKKVLFVCVHNSGRSQMAEAFFNEMAKGRALAYSAGTSPGAVINPVVVKAMREIGVDISNNKPKLLTIDLISHADKVITMGCGEAEICPAAYVPVEDWGLEDPEGKVIIKVREIRNQIRVKVQKLIDEIGF